MSRDDLELAGDHLVGTAHHRAVVIDFVTGRAVVLDARRRRRCRIETSLDGAWLTVASSCPDRTELDVYRVEALFSGSL